jgi:hypothetical protein
VVRCVPNTRPMVPPSMEPPPPASLDEARRLLGEARSLEEELQSGLRDVVTGHAAVAAAAALEELEAKARWRRAALEGAATALGCTARPPALPEGVPPATAVMAADGQEAADAARGSGGESVGEVVDRHFAATTGEGAVVSASDCADGGARAGLGEVWQAARHLFNAGQAGEALECLHTAGVLERTPLAVARMLRDRTADGDFSAVEAGRYLSGAAPARRRARQVCGRSLPRVGWGCGVGVGVGSWPLWGRCLRFGVHGAPALHQAYIDAFALTGLGLCEALRETCANIAVPTERVAAQRLLSAWAEHFVKASHAADHGWLATLEAGLKPGGPAERYRQHRAQEACVGLRGRLGSYRPPRQEEGGGGMGTTQRNKVS